MKEVPSNQPEMLDIVDQYGEPTGEQYDKATVHQEGMWHRDVHVWITDGVNLLEQQRRWDKTIMPGEWDISVGGHVAANESYLEAAQRETREELGLAFDEDRYIGIGKLTIELPMENGAWTHRIVGDNFVVVEQNLTVDDLTLQASEVLGARLYPIDQLEADLSAPETARLHASQPPELWALGLTAIREIIEGGAPM
ncbi:MAG TPA: NUDIX domain-containing protein [Candidatus Saccharimonadales bacterium]|nr:NUDIX domain-containing protein [Candidatus Saccharimonadales bacterium]